MAISKSNLDFLRALKKNNNREWFAENKEKYEAAHENMIGVADEVLNLLQQHDDIETASGKKSLYRIYRDVRFSKDKSPYKTHWGSYFRRATKFKRGGMGFHTEPDGKTMVGGGFWSPNKDDLEHIRKQITLDPEPLRKILKSKSFKDTFGEMTGEQLKTAPKGWPKDHESIDLLRYKQFLIGKKFTDKEIMSPDFAQNINNTFKAMRPFFDYFSDILTSDLNGEPLD